MFADRFEIFDRTDSAMQPWDHAGNRCGASAPNDAQMPSTSRAADVDQTAADYAACIDKNAGTADIRWTKVMLARTAITDGWFDRDSVLNAVVEPLADVLR